MSACIGSLLEWLEDVADLGFSVARSETFGESEVTKAVIVQMKTSPASTLRVEKFDLL